MSKILFGVVVVIGLAVSSPLEAGQIFDLRDASIEDIDESTSFDLFGANGLVVTVSANIGVLNRTSSAFGINAPLTGDDTDTIDAINGIEAVILTFNRHVLFDAMTLSLYTPEPSAAIEDIAGLTIGAFPTVYPAAINPAVDPYSFNSNNFVAIGQSVELQWVQGNGFSFDNFTVTVIPEPSTFALLGIGGLALVGFGWRRKQRQVA